MDDAFPLLYQSVDLDLDLINGSCKASTELWIGLKELDYANFSNKLYLHCRKCQIQKVEVNGVPTSFKHVDPLSTGITGKSLSQPSTKDKKAAVNATNDSFLAEEIDLCYRSALEITRCGELEITLPDQLPVCPVSLPALPSKILSKSKHQDIKVKRDKIVKIVNALKESYYDVNDNMEGFPKLFTIKIEYTLSSSAREGVIFRKRDESDEYACAYTLSQGTIPYCDPHGVRCWMPCIDSPAQRPMYDITIHAPQHSSIQSSGTLIDAQTAPSSSSSKASKMQRYLTVNNVSSSALGFFVGRTEQYSVPLYRVVGKVWVARGLVDFVKGMPLKASSATEAKRGRAPSSFSRQKNEESQSKRPRSSGPDAAVESTVGDDGRGEGADGSDPSSDDEDDTLQSVSGRLYRDVVRHTTLGLDLATRLIHKTTQRRFEHSQYCQIFVPYLEEDFLSFDGFSLVDARFLIGPEQITQETSSHLLQLRAYLFSWLATGSCLPINSTDNEFLLHGFIASILRSYCDTIFGEDQGALMQQRAHDCVVMLEKLGFSYSLSDPYFPESFDRFSPYYAQYYSAKAAWLFYALQTRLGGRDALRQVIQALIRAPPLVVAQVLTQGSLQRHDVLSAHKRTHRDVYSYGFNQDEQFGASLAFLGLMPSPGHSSDPGSPLYDRYSDQASPSYPYMTNSVGMYSPGRSEGGTSPNPYLMKPASPNPYLMNIASPNPYALQPSASSPNPYATVSSPNPYAYIPQPSPNPYMYSQSSPNPYAAAATAPAYAKPDLTSPRSRSNSLDLNGGGGTARVPSSAVERDADSFPVPLPPARGPLVRQASIASDSGTVTSANDFLKDTALTLENFITSAQLLIGTDADLDESFYQRYISDSGISLIRFGVFVGVKADGKPQSMTLVADSVPLKHGKLSTKGDGGEPVQEVRTRVVEVRDDMVTEPTIRVKAGTDATHHQPLFTKPGRRGGRKKTVVDGDLTPAQMAMHIRLEAEKEANKDVLELARDRDEPVRYAILDPSNAYVLGDVHIISSDASLVELLYSEVDDCDLPRHFQAIRALARVPPVNYPPSVAYLAPKQNSASFAMSKRDNAFRIRALIDCIFGNPISSGGTDVLQGGHALQVRIEAALALAQWQVERAPTHVETYNDLSSSDSAARDKELTREDEWVGLNKLIEIIHELYFDSSTLLPTSCDWTRESQVLLRCALLIALSHIKATNRLSPRSVVNTLLMFSENHVNRPVSSSGSQLSEDDDVADVKVKVEETETKRAAPKRGRKMVVYDDSHYVTSLLLSLKNVRLDQHAKRDPKDPLRRITDFALTRLRTDISMAKARARVQFNRDAEDDGDYVLPVLPMCGAVSAAAITCLGEMDVQFLMIVDKVPSDNSDFAIAGCLELAGKNMTLLGPSGLGGCSSVCYTEFFVPAHHKLTLTKASVAAPSDTAPVHKWNKDPEMYPWSVRLAGLEAFIRLSLTQCHLFTEKVKRRRQQLKKQEEGRQVASPNVPQPVFIPAILEAVLVIVRSDPDRRTRRGAALCLLECLQDRPSGRTAMAALASGDSSSCIGSSDPEALTRLDFDAFTTRPVGRKSNSAIYKDLFLRAEGAHMKQALKTFWHTISHNPGDEVVRALLYRTWVYVYGTAVPPCLLLTELHKGKLATAAASVQETKGQLWDTEALSRLPKDRFVVKDSSECLHKSEMVLRHGKGYKVAGPQLKLSSDLNNSDNALLQPLKPAATGLRLSLSAIRPSAS